ENLHRDQSRPDAGHAGRPRRPADGADRRTESGTLLPHATARPARSTINARQIRRASGTATEADHQDRHPTQGRRQCFLGARRNSGSTRAGERAPMAQAKNAIGKGKAMRARLTARPFWMIDAARATGIRSGIGKSFTAVIGVVTKPGMITLTPTPAGAISPRKPSPQTFTAAFEPQ